MNENERAGAFPPVNPGKLPKCPGCQSSNVLLKSVGAEGDKPYAYYRCLDCGKEWSKPCMPFPPVT